MKTSDRGRRSGQILAGVVMLVLVLLILVPAMVKWIQIDSAAGVKTSRATLAFNLAEAGIERGSWKVKASSAAFNQATVGTVIAGYNNDTTYSDVAGGTYRIKLTAGGAGSNSFTVTAEGRDSASKEVRAIQAIFKSQTIYSPLMATQRINWGKGMCPMWGPLMSQSDINLTDDYVANWYFPRKMAKGVVTGTVNNPRDTNGLNPPNTDNAEWWSDYRYVPDVPIIDFATLRSSAVATHTLNVYGCKSGAGYTDPVNGTAHAGAAPWDGRGACNNSGTHPTAAANSGHFSSSYNHPKGTRLDPNNTYVWYYDGDVVLGGDGPPGTNGIGLRGSLIVRGNLTLDSGGNYNYTGSVPANAYAEFSRLTKTTYDSAATAEYPADNGFHTNTATFGFGSTSFCVPASGSCGWQTTVGVRGFTYVGGNLVVNANGFMDFNGAVWVNGSVTAAGADDSHFCGIFFDDQLSVPTLNVVLSQQSWKEVSASGTAWP